MPDSATLDAGQTPASPPAAAPPTARARAWFWIRLLVTLGLVAVLLRTVDFRRALETISHADLWLVLLLLPISLLDRFVMAFKWNLLLQARSLGLRVLEAYRIYLAATFVGYWLPTGVGADVFRAVRVTAGGRGVSEVSATILLERALGLLAMVTLSVIGLSILVVRGDTRVHQAWLLALALFAAVLGGLVFSIQPRLFEWVRRATARWATLRPVRMVLGFHDAYVELSRHRGTLLVFLLISLAEQVLQVTMAYVLARAIHLPVTMLQFCALLPMSNVLVTLPITVASIGVMEGTYILALSRAGVTPAGALSLSLLMRATTLLFLVPCGLAFLWDAAMMRRRVTAGAVPAGQGP
jgi:hypothetical protein